MGDETPAAHALRTAGAAAEAAAAARAYEKTDNLLTTAELVERQKATLALQGAARGRIARKKVAQARAMEAEGRKRSALLHAKGSGVDIKKRGAAAAAVNDQQKAILGNAQKLLEGEEVAWFGSAKEKEKGGAKKGAKGAKGGDTPLGAAMKSAKITSDKVRGTKKSAGHAAAAAAKTKKATAMAPAVSEASRREATNRALLATAFAAECRDGDTAKGVPLHRLSKVLSRAHVPGAELHELSPAAAELAGSVKMSFDEVAAIAEKLRARRTATLAAGAAAHPALIDAGADGTALRREARVALAQAFAQNDDGSGGLAATALPHAFAAAGLARVDSRRRTPRRRRRAERAAARRLPRVHEIGVDAAGDAGAVGAAGLHRSPPPPSTCSST